MTTDLRKQVKVSPLTDLKRRLEAFLNRHALFFLCICMIILFILITCLVYAVFGATVESGNYYYHLGDVI